MGLRSQTYRLVTSSGHRQVFLNLKARISWLLRILLKEEVFSDRRQRHRSRRAIDLEQRTILRVAFSVLLRQPHNLSRITIHSVETFSVAKQHPTSNHRAVECSDQQPSHRVTVSLHHLIRNSNKAQGYLGPARNLKMALFLAAGQSPTKSRCHSCEFTGLLTGSNLS